jgi:peptidyl-prolyl cis-trans isomerase B (cyclophilin B)
MDTYEPAYTCAGDEVAVITTSKGVIKFTFFSDVAPKHSAAFVELAEKGFYDGPGYNLAAEFNARPHLDGTVSMARAGHPDSAGSQFYICLGPQAFLNGNYTVFGQVTDGLDVVHSIARDDVMESVKIERG